MTTVAEIASAARIRIGLPDDDGYLSAADVVETLVNKAQADIAASLDWPELQVEDSLVIVGPSPYPLPLGGNFTRLLWAAIDGAILLPKQRRELLYPADAGQGQPRWMAVGGDGAGGLQLWVAPEPDDTYTITYAYMQRPAYALSAEDILLPLHLHDCLTTRTAYLMAIRKKDLDMAATLLGEYREDLKIHQDEAQIMRGPIAPKVREDW